MAAARKVLFSAVKNEAPFLLEWIAYHRAIGFDRFVIVSNDSDDGTTELLDALQAHGIVHHLHHAVGPDESPQGKAALAANASGLIEDGDWVIWLDADEFLNIHAGAGRVDDLVAAMGDAQGMVIPWRIFGDSGHATFPGRFISPDFTRAAEREDSANKLVKTFYRHQGDRVRLSAITNHRPHLHDPKAYRAADFVDAGGQLLDRSHRPNRRWLKGVEGKANFSIPDTNYRWDAAQINHYMLRTREMFDLKAHRGRGYVNMVKGQPVHRPRHTPEFFAKNNRNEAEDTSILRHAAATDRELEALMAIAEVRAAQEAGLRQTAARLQAMAAEELRLSRPETVSLLCCMRNEGMFIVEWVAYYRMIGVDNIVVFTNHCTDGSDQLLARLAALGYVHHVDHAPEDGISPQNAAAAQAMNMPLILESDWLLHVDADEFLDVDVGDETIHALIQEVGTDADVIALHWKLFGHDDVTCWEGGSVLQQFTHSQGIPIRRAVHHKSMFRPAKFGRCANHMPKEPLVADIRVVNTAGARLNPSMIRIPIKSRYKTKFHQLTYKNAALNHYAVKSPDLFLMKNDRGDGHGAQHTKYYLNSLLHRRYDRNEVEDRAILRRWPQVEALMAEMRADPEVRRLEAEALAAWRRRRQEVLTAEQVALWTARPGEDEGE